METLELATKTWKQLTLFAEATHAQSTQGPEVTDPAKVPICPDTSLPWSEDSNLGGWSARMFLHQLLTTSMPHWTHLDTEQLLSEWTPQRLQGSHDKEISLSDVIKKPGMAYEDSFRTSKMVQGLIRRALARGKSLRVLLRTEQDTIPVIVTFLNPDDYESWTVTSERRLPDYLKDGLMDFLKQHAPRCAGTL